MHLITSHLNTDFDSLASMVAVQKLYPDAVICPPGSPDRKVKDFMSRHAHQWGLSGQAEQIRELSKSYPKTGRAYRIVSALDDFYACQTMEEAKEAFFSLYSWMRRCRLEPMKKAAQTLCDHKEKILNFFSERLTNAISEGFNSLFQAAKRKARGYGTMRGFIDMIYLIAGKLNLAVPIPLPYSSNSGGEPKS